MRLDYALYVLAVVFFLVTIVSALVVMETERDLWVVSTVILGLFSMGLGYYVRPKTKTVAAQPAVTTPPPQQPVTGDVHEKEAYKVENSTATQTPILPQSPTSIPAPVIAPMPVLTPTPSETVAVPKLELTEVKGIGEKRAEQLKAIGISNVDELAKASAEDIAKKLKISPKIVDKWVASAKELAK
ncbi:MAG: helix-hairpin-helix domain-containing protein [Candidatus Bathyarchaeota archaeon]|nr:helix-hairpin-helix domain-containing protein [Candidatus Bathyarchaeota archaeon]